MSSSTESSPSALPSSLQIQQPIPSEAEKGVLLDSAREIIVGSISGAIGKVVEFPFDTIKVRLQYSQSLPSPLFKSTTDCIKQTYLKEGLYNGFYKGLLSPMIGASAEVSCLFFSYRLAQHLIIWVRNLSTEAEITFTEKLYCGAISGILTSFILTPIELVKCKMQVENLKNDQKGQQNSGRKLNDFIKLIYKQDGLKGFWKGQSTTLLREAGGSTAWFGAYEYTLGCFKKGDKNYDHKAHELLLAGAAAGIGYNVSLFPADTVKNTLQTNDGNDKKISDIVKDIYRLKGLKGFYSGLGVTLVKTIPASAIMFYSYEQLKKNMLF